MEFGLLQLIEMEKSLKYRIGLLETAFSQYEGIELDDEAISIEISLDFSNSALKLVKKQIQKIYDETKEPIS